jgi:hypothetical protein
VVLILISWLGRDTTFGFGSILRLLGANFLAEAARCIDAPVSMMNSSCFNSRLAPTPSEISSFARFWKVVWSLSSGRASTILAPKAKMVIRFAVFIFVNMVGCQVTSGIKVNLVFCVEAGETGKIRALRLVCVEILQCDVTRLLAEDRK